MGRRVLAALVCALSVPFCAPSGADRAVSPEGDGSVIRVRDGQRIADALERARPGSVVEVEPGTYREALAVDVPDVTLRGLVRGEERPLLAGGGELNDAVIASGSPFHMSGFRIRGYRGNGVTTQGVRGVVLADLQIEDPGLYGVYPIESWNVEVSGCVVSGASDAGIYVGGSNGVQVTGNTAFRNVVGIQIENTNDARVADNVVRDNAVGILVGLAPFRIQKSASGGAVKHNRVLENNLANFGDPNSLVGRLPSGIGVLLMGADGIRIAGNTIRGNHRIGVGLMRLPEAEALKDPDLEPLPDANRLGRNNASENGKLPPATDGLAPYAGSVVWDGTGRGNCTESPAVSSVPMTLSTCDTD